ncbi:MAG TPA: TonB-dependent receptor [Candidatus Baltobacteraceae bacterium]
MARTQATTMFAHLMLLLVTVLFAASGDATAPHLRVIDEMGNAVAHVAVTFVDAGGAQDIEESGDDGSVSPRATFTPVLVHIEAPRFVPLRVDLHGPLPTTLVLKRAISVIANVRVATGTQRGIHELPVPASALDRAALANTPASASDALLRDLPGYDHTRSNSAFTNYGQLRLSLNGAGNDRGVLLVDDVPAQDAFGGQIDWAAYPAANITRAELLRGAGSALYGSGAIGGVLALQTRAPEQTAVPSGFLSLGAGGDGGANESAFAQGSIGPRLGATLWSSTTKLAYYDFPASYASPVSYTAHSQSDATQLRLRYALGSGTLEASGLYSTDAQDEGRPNYTFARALQQYALHYARESGATALSVIAYQRDTTLVNVNDSYPVKPGVLQYVQTVPTWENGLSASFAVDQGHNEVQARVDHRAVHGYSNQVGQNDAFQTFGGGSQMLTGYALQDTLHGTHFEALAGARYDTITFTNGSLVAAATPAPTVTLAPARTDAAISPRAAFRYDVSPGAALRLSAGSGFRAPYLNELVRSFSIGKVVYAPNINLVPERSFTQSVGLDLLGPSTHLSLDIFDTGVSNAIEYVTVSPTLMQHGNIEHTKTDGTTLSVTQAFGPCTRLRLGGTSQYARISAAGPSAAPGSAGKQPQFVPDRSASLALDVTGPPVHYGIDVDYLGQTFADDLNTEPLGAALLFGFRATAPMSNGATWSVTWQNITDQRELTSVDRVAPPSQAAVQYTFPLGRRDPQSQASCT